MKSSIYVTCILFMCVSCHADKYLLPLLKTAEQITTDITKGGDPCKEDCPYSYKGKLICGFCCPDYGSGSRKCPAYVNDYNGCGPGHKSADQDPKVKEIQDKINKHGKDSNQTATFFAPICNYHDMCYQDPTKTADICNAILDSNIHAFCDEYYGYENVNWKKIGPNPPGVVNLLKQEQYQHLRDCSFTASGLVNAVKFGAMTLPYMNYYNTGPDKKYATQCKKPKTGHKADMCDQHAPPSPSPPLPSHPSPKASLPPSYPPPSYPPPPDKKCGNSTECFGYCPCKFGKVPICCACEKFAPQECCIFTYLCVFPTCGPCYHTRYNYLLATTQYMIT